MSKRFALCIGVNDYPGTDMDLSGCVNDANDWAVELTSRGFAVTQLIDKAATRAAMRKAIAKLLAGAVKGDSVALTFSGHGTYAPDADGDEADGYDEGLCGYDIVRNGPLIDDEIRELFAARKAGVRVLMISDSCHSGTVTRAVAADDASARNTPRVRFLPLRNWMPDAPLPRGDRPVPVAASPFRSALRKVGGDLLMAGCEEGPERYSYDAHFNGRANGAFTYFALRTLRTLPASANYAQWHQAIRDHLPSAHYPQTPQLFGSAATKKRKVLR